MPWYIISFLILLFYLVSQDRNFLDIQVRLREEEEAFKIFDYLRKCIYLLYQEAGFLFCFVFYQCQEGINE